MKHGKKDTFDPILVASAFYPHSKCDHPVVGSKRKFMNLAITHRRTILAVNLGPVRQTTNEPLIGD